MKYGKLKLINETVSVFRTWQLIYPQKNSVVYGTEHCSNSQESDTSVTCTLYSVTWPQWIGGTAAVICKEAKIWWIQKLANFGVCI
jgi:hypothetical protein